MYDTVIGNRPNEHGLIDVHNPAVYNIPNELIDSTIFVVVDEDDEEDEVITAFASDAPILWAEYIVSSNIVLSPIILIPSSEEEIIGDGE